MRKVVALVLVALLVLGVGGWVVAQVATRVVSDGSQPVPATPRSPSPAETGSDRPPRPDLADFYGQRLDWQTCGDHECARLRVPLDYDRPEGRTLQIALLRVPATGAPVGSLVVNPGGPGSPGTSYAAAAGRVLGDPVRRSYDVVGFDPRGTGSSSPVDCFSDAELDDYHASDPSPDDAAERREFVGLVRAFGRGCVEDDAELAAHVTTVEAARDMDVLRSALGHRQLDYYGASYGTKLGATYAELHPDQVGRFVLDGGVDVSLESKQQSLGQARGFETALRAYVADCVETVDSCFLGDSVDEGLTRITDFLERVDAEPLPTGEQRELTVGLAFYGIVTPLYVRDYWFLLSRALRAGFAGDGSSLLDLADLYASRGPDGYTDNSAEAFLAISCLDDPSAVPAARVPAELPDFREASPTFGDVFAWGMVSCLGQVAEATVPPLEIDAAGAAPIMVVGTTRDPATPYAWSEALAAQLASGVLVTRDGDGHTGYNAGNACVDDAVEAYLLDGTVPDDGLTC